MARALVLAVLAILVAPSVHAGEDDAPHLLIRLDNEGGEATIADILVERASDGATIHHGAVEVAANSAVDLRIDAPEGVYDVELTVASALTRAIPDQPLAERSRQWTTASSAGCPGAYEVRFALTGGVGTRGDAAGCTTLTAAFLALFAEARASRAGMTLASARVPPPGVDDRGAFAIGEAEVPFAWSDGRTFLDAWGMPIVGAELTYRDPSMSAVGTGSFLGDLHANAEETNEVLRYPAGDPRLLSWTRTHASFGESAPGAASVQLAREVRYDARPGMLPCLARSAIQGATLRPGDEVGPDAFCAAWMGPAWRVGAPLDHRGLRALPLYQTEESSERTLVARLLVADGIPYPIAFERHELRAGELVRSIDASLVAYEPAGAPLASASAPAAPRALPLAPIDALRGPALADRARLAFPLAEASDAARANPALRDAQLVLARPGAALVGAHYARVKDEGAPFAALRWTLAFAAQDVEPAYVVCERADLAFPVAPPAACRDAMDAPFDAPPLGRSAIPTRGASFDDAIARWDATRAEGPGAEVTRALYLASGALVVGAGSAEALTPMGEAPTGAADLVALDLATARTLAHVEIAEASAPLLRPTAPWDAERLEAGDAAWSLGAASPYALGAGAAALAALLGFLLYSRLHRARVLDDATRARIHEAVAREPGLHASGILAALGKPHGVGEYHLDVLVREGYLTALATPGFKRYFVAGRHSAREMRAIAAMREGQNDRLLRIIRAKPGIPLGALAEEAGVSLPYASKSVARLAEAGLVEKTQVGRAIALRAIEA